DVEAQFPGARGEAFPGCIGLATAQPVLAPCRLAAASIRRAPRATFAFAASAQPAVGLRLAVAAVVRPRPVRSVRACRILGERRPVVAARARVPDGFPADRARHLGSLQHLRAPLLVDAAFLAFRADLAVIEVAAPDLVERAGPILRRRGHLDVPAPPV